MPAWTIAASASFALIIGVLAWIDIKTRRLPDYLTLPLIPAGLLVAYFTDVSRLPAHLIGAFAGFVVFASISIAYRHLRQRDGLGMGDAKLLAAAGAWVGWQGLPTVVFGAAVLALAFAVILQVAGRKLTLETALPFGPFLGLATWLVWIGGPLVVTWGPA